VRRQTTFRSIMTILSLLMLFLALPILPLPLTNGNLPPPRRQRPVEPTLPIHILSRLELLVPPNPIIPIIPWHLGVLGALEPSEPHRLHHLPCLVVYAFGPRGRFAHDVVFDVLVNFRLDCPGRYASSGRWWWASCTGLGAWGCWRAAVAAVVVAPASSAIVAPTPRVALVSSER
jgi:hypothetical protein